MDNLELQRQRLLSYSVVFTDRHDKIEDLITSVPSNSAIEFLSYILAQKVNQLVYDHDVSIWAPWILNTCDYVKNPIGKYAQQIDIGDYALIDKYSLLLLISRLIVCYNGNSDELTEEDRSNLLLAYMLCCDERLEQTRDLPYNKMSAAEFVRNFMPDCVKSDDIESPRDYRLLMIKCYMLLIEFPKQNAQFAEYVNAFCEEKGLSSAKKYIDEIFLTFLNLSSEDTSNCLMEIDESSKVASGFFDSLSIDTLSYKHDSDFSMMRERPILKTGPRRYDFLFMKMFLDKAYKGLLFDMKNALVKRGMLDSRTGYTILRSLLGSDFSERFFFYSLMRRCFTQQYIHFCGEELERTLGDGLPDYYMRQGNKVFVFECKDAQVAAKQMLCGDYDTIKDAIFKKYVKNSKGHGKGVTQLVNVIEKKLPIILSRVDTRSPSSIFFVFPIIVYYDNCLDVEGPNYLLNEEFHRILSKKTIPVDYEVKDLVMVNIEQLMRLEDFFVNGRLDLALLINKYIEYKSLAELNQVFPFNKFLFQEARDKGYEMKKTKWFDEVFQVLVDMDN